MCVFHVCIHCVIVICTVVTCPFLIYRSPPMSDDNRKHKELMRKQTHNEGKKF